MSISRRRSMIRILFLLALVVSSLPAGPARGALVAPPPLIAHAGGSIDGLTYTNSLEALNENYNKGHRFFELDFSWTSDRELVAIHDWDRSFPRLFDIPEGIKVPTAAQFLGLRMKSGLHPLSLQDVLQWVEEKGDVFIITDVKEDNVEALRKIHTDFRQYQKYFIPQIYSYREYRKVRKLGYKDIILTVYRMKVEPRELLDFAMQYKLFAVTMPWEVAQKGLARFLQGNNIFVYAHTVNDVELFDSLKKAGVSGIYTDHIIPGRIGAAPGG